MATQTSIIRVMFMVVMTALTNGKAHGPPVGFGMITGFVDNPGMPPCVELFRLTEHDWDIGASTVDADDAVVDAVPVMVKSPPLTLLTVRAIEAWPLLAAPLVALESPLVALVDPEFSWSHMELSTFTVRLPMFVVENMVDPRVEVGFEEGFDDKANGENGWRLSLWSLNPIASLSLPISSWPSLACVQVSFLL
jgi:hypothetical protein